MSLLLSDPSTAEAVLRQVSLAIVGIIIWSSVNRVLRGVASALKVTSRAAIKDVVLLVITQVMVRLFVSQRHCFVLVEC